MKNYPRSHAYKGFEIVNIQRAAQLKRPAFHILNGEQRAVGATPTMRSARWLIDLWAESRYCACGAPHMPHDYRCKNCAKKGVPHESQLLRQRHRVA